MKKIIIPWIAKVKSLKFRGIAKGIFLLWQTTVNLRAVSQGVIPDVANRGTLDDGLPSGYSCCDKRRYWSVV
jgi:hypothetical protein